MTAIGDLELKGLPEPVPTCEIRWKQTDGAVDLRADALHRTARKNVSYSRVDSYGPRRHRRTRAHRR